MKNRFIEMANVLKMDTELPMNIWIDSEGAYIKGGHAKRIGSVRKKGCFLF